MKNENSVLQKLGAIRIFTNLDTVVLAGAIAGRRYEGAGRVKPLLLRLFPWLVEQQPQSVEGRASKVGGLHFGGQGGKKASVYSRPRAIFTLKLDTDVGVVETDHLHRQRGGRLKRGHMYRTKSQRLHRTVAAACTTLATSYTKSGLE